MITTLGSLHGYMLKNPGYTPRDLLAAMAAYRPELILSEVRPEAPGPAAGAVDGGIEQAMVYAMAEHLGAQVVPADWFDEDFILASEREEACLPPAVRRQIDAAAESYIKDIAGLPLLGLNAPAVQAKVRALYALQEERGLRLSRKRNEMICSNIETALRGRAGLKTMVIFGLDHKYFLDDRLRAIGQAPAEVSDWLTPAALAGYRVPRKIKEDSLRNLKASESLLASRLGSGYYSGAFKDKLAAKLRTYPSWACALERL